MNTFRKLVVAGTAVIFLVSYQPVEAQIWKKIKERTKERVEDIIVEKTADKAAEITAENMDRILNADFNPYGGGDKKEAISSSELPDSYIFEWKYQLSMEMENPEIEDPIVFDYYLSQDNSYFGFSMDQMRSLFTVIDEQAQVSVSYIEQGEKPMALAYKLPDAARAESAQPMPEFTITELSSKTFMGYESAGLQMENTEQRIVMYVATDVPVGFTGMYNAASNKNLIPENFQKLLSEQGYALLMYAKIVDKNNPDKTVEMECVSLEEIILVKQNSNYTFSES